MQTPATEKKLFHCYSSVFTTIIFFIALTGAQTVAAQNGSVTGVIKNDSSAAVENVSVLLLKKADSGFVAGTITDKKGQFQLKVKQYGSFIIRISKLGFKTKFLEIAVSTSAPVYNTGQVLLEQEVTELKEVVIRSNRPMVQLQDDKLVFNVENDPSLKGLMATDALRKTPFVIVDGNGSISIAGKRTLRVLLNGKATGIVAFNPSEVLKTFPADMIKRIEVITQPSSKYDAEGTGGVINIVTKKNIQGYFINNGVGISSNFNQYSAPGFSNNFAIKYGRFGISGYWSSSWNRLNDITRQTDYLAKQTTAPFYRRYADEVTNQNIQSNQGDFELSWDLDSLSSISGYGTVRTNSEDNVSNKMLSLFDRSGASLDRGNWSSTQQKDLPKNSWGLDYTKKFKKNTNGEFSLLWNIQKTKSDNTTNNVQNNQTIVDRSVINSNQFKNVQHIIQADLSLPTKGTDRLEVGAKSILRKAHSDYMSLLQNAATGKYEADISNTNVFSFSQQVWSTYVSYRFSFGKLRIVPGYRLEHTYLNGSFKTTGTTAVQRYTNLFPNVAVYQNFGKNNNQRLSFSYNKSLSRPDISYLNPFVDNNDPLFINYGNPNVNPEFGHSISLGYSITKPKITFNGTVYYEITTDEILGYTALDASTGITTTSFANLGKTIRKQLSFFFSVRPVKNLSINIPMNIFHLDISSKTPVGINNNGWGASGNINVSYRLNAKLDFVYSSSLQIPGINLQGRLPNTYYYNFSAHIRVLKNKGRITLSTTNPFDRSLLFKQTIESKDFAQTDKQYQPRTRVVGISFGYTISKLKENISRKKVAKANDLKTRN